MCTEIKRHILMAAACALLLVLCLPAAQAGAKARYMFGVFEDAEFEGAVIESYAVDGRCGAAILRFADGTRRAFTYGMDDEGWAIADRSGDLSNACGANRVSVDKIIWSSSGDFTLDIGLYEDERLSGTMRFEGDLGEMTLHNFSSKDGELARAYIPTLRDLRFDSVWWGCCYYNSQVQADGWVDAERDYQYPVLKANHTLSRDEFSVPLNGLDLRELLTMLGERAEEGVSFVEESERLDAVAVRRENGIPVDIPMLPESRDVAYALPAPALAQFAPGQRFDVYTGPGTHYLREEDGQASVSTDDWILVLGEENGWLMVFYRVNDEQMRFGWIEATQEQAGVSVPTFSWANEPVWVGRRITNDPFLSETPIVDGLKSSRDGTLIGVYAMGWAYVETATDDGTAMRGFVFEESFGYIVPDDAFACVTLGPGESTALYDAPGGEEIGRLYPGVDVAIKEERDGFLRVIAYAYSTWPSIVDLTVQGWIDETAVTRSTYGNEYFYDEDYEPARIVWLMDEDETLEDMAQGGAYAVALLAEFGNKAYMKTINDSLAVIAPRSSVQQTTRGRIDPPEDYAFEEDCEGYVIAYPTNCGAGVVSGKNTFDYISITDFSPGTNVAVLMHADGAALVYAFTEHGPEGTYWVDECTVIETE